MTDYNWLPFIPSPAGFERNRISPTATMRSPLTGSVQVSPRAGGRWMLTCEWSVKGDDMTNLEGLLTRLNGMENRLTLPMFDYYAGVKPNRGAWEGATTVTVAGGGQTGTQLTMAGATPNTTQWVSRGDFFQFDNCIRMAVAGVDSDGAGNFNLRFWPPIRTSPADGTPLVIDPTIEGSYRMIEYSPVPIFDSLASGEAYSTIGATFEDDVLA